MPPRAIVFDAVGTLLHPEPPVHQVYGDIGRRFGSRYYDKVIRQRFATAFVQEEDVDARSCDDATSEQREHERWQHIVAAVLDDVDDFAACFAALYEHFAQPASWRCDPAAEGLLEFLATQGWTIAMASNFDKRLRGIVSGLKELRHVSQLFISSEIGWKKPNERFFDAVTRGLGLPAKDILCVGDDWLRDYVGATSSGMKAVWVDQRGEYRYIPLVNHEDRVWNLGEVRAWIKTVALE